MAGMIKKKKDIKKDFGWLYLNSEDTQDYKAADGSWGTKSDDGSAWYTGMDGSSGHRDKDGNISYFGKNGTMGFRYPDGSGAYYGPRGKKCFFEAGDGPDTDENFPEKDQNFAAPKGAWSAYLAASADTDMPGLFKGKKKK